MLEQCCKHLKQCRYNVATLFCTKNRRCVAFRADTESYPVHGMNTYLVTLFFKVMLHGTIRNDDF